MDTNGDGQLSLQELETALDKLGYSSSEIYDMFQEADADMSGDISFQEFKTCMVKKLTMQTRNVEETRTAYVLFGGEEGQGGVDKHKVCVYVCWHPGIR
jgi:Ca2+-binding EF-hand superfamily protein